MRGVACAAATAAPSGVVSSDRVLVPGHPHNLVRKGEGGFGCDGQGPEHNKVRFNCESGCNFDMVRRCIASSRTAHPPAVFQCALCVSASYQPVAPKPGKARCANRRKVAMYRLLFMCRRQKVYTDKAPRRAFHPKHGDGKHLISSKPINFHYKCDLCGGEDDGLYGCDENYGQWRAARGPARPLATDS
jgi:hypothetical protein